MITFEASTEQDVNRIQSWTDADVYHHGQNNPRWWLTGNGMVSFRLDDEKGPIFYVRIDEGEHAQVSIQFAPTEVVTKRRLVLALMEAFPRVVQTIKSFGCIGMAFNSTSPTLIKFMDRVGFVKQDDSYVLTFGA